MREYTDALSSGAEERRDFRLKMTSVTTSLTAFFGEDGAPGEKPSMPVMAKLTARPKVETERVESRTVGSISRRGGRVVLSYEDAVDDDEEPVPTELSFEPAEPGLVTLERKGFLRSTMIFEAGARHRATYKTPLLSFEMTVFSRAVENTLGEDGGRLRLEYALEFRGAAEQKVEFTLEAARI